MQLSKFFIHLSNKYFIQAAPQTTGVTALPIYKRSMEFLLDRFNFDNLYELSSYNLSNDTAYTLYKKYIYICLNNKVYPNNIYNINTVLFVLLHELAHLSNNSWDHPDEFWKLFKFYLYEAACCGIYIPINYKIKPEQYCNTCIRYNPLYDDSIVM